MKNFDPILLVGKFTLFCLLNIDVRKQKIENLRDEISSFRIRPYSVVSEMITELFPLSQKIKTTVEPRLTVIWLFVVFTSRK